jgi:hypothetical protein
MTHKEKAEELVDKFLAYTPADSEYEYPYAKECALLAVNEIINSLKCFAESDDWKQVKEEIEKL